MIVSRALSFFLRFMEFVCGAIVLGLIAHFLHLHHTTHIGPHGREIYVTVVSAISVVLSLLWLLPLTASFMHYPFDLIMSFAWFAAFGALFNWVHHHLGCRGVFHFIASGFHQSGNQCGRWKATEAFSFIGACFWLASALLSMYVFHKVGNRRVTKTEHA